MRTMTSPLDAYVESERPSLGDHRKGCPVASMVYGYDCKFCNQQFEVGDLVKGNQGSHGRIVEVGNIGYMVRLETDGVLGQKRGDIKWFYKTDVAKLVAL